jgi:GIY-YIG catalytic domain
MFVYVIVCSESLKIYIGQHKGKNLRQYLQQKLSEASRGLSSRSHLYNAMRKYPRDSWSIHPLVSGIESRQDLDELEKHFIRVLKSRHPDIGYNICRGGEGFTGPHTEQWRHETLARVQAYWANPENRAKRAAQMKLRWQTNPEFRQKMVELGKQNHHCLGRVQSAEEKKQRSLSNKGKQNTLGHRLSPEHRHKISLGLKRRVKIA